MNLNNATQEEQTIIVGQIQKAFDNLQQLFPHLEKDKFPHYYHNRYFGTYLRNDDVTVLDIAKTAQNFPQVSIYATAYVQVAENEIHYPKYAEIDSVHRFLDACKAVANVHYFEMSQELDKIEQESIVAKSELQAAQNTEWMLMDFGYRGNLNGIGRR